MSKSISRRAAGHDLAAVLQNAFVYPVLLKMKIIFVLILIFIFNTSRYIRLTRSSMSAASLPRMPAVLAFVAALGPLVTGFGACTTDNPREAYRAPAAGRGASSGGSATGGTGGTTSTNGGSRGGSDSAEGARGGARNDANGANGGSSSRGSGDSSPPGAGGTKPVGVGGAGATAATSPGHSGEGADAGAAGSGQPPPEDDCAEPPVTDEPFTKRALRSAAADCARWHYCKFAGKAAVLDAAVRAHVAAPDGVTLAATQSAWRAAMATFSSVELFQFGPLASRADSAGRDGVHGEGIRDFIYSWPLNTRCRIEEQLASQRYEQGFADVLVSSRGLTALEYLLFYAGNDTACSSGSATATVFAALTPDALAERKLAYLRAVSSDVLANARRVVERWDPAGGNFRQTFIDASGYEDEQHALTILAWSLLYVEREVKDWKLGIPAGLSVNQPVNGPETPFAHQGTQAVAGNLQGFRRLFQGCGEAGEGLGFDDWLVAAGHAELATDILRALDAVEVAAARFPALEGASPAELESFYFTLKALTNFLKDDLFGAGSPLNLKLPMTVQGATD